MDTSMWVASENRHGKAGVPLVRTLVVDKLCLGSHLTKTQHFAHFISFSVYVPTHTLAHLSRFHLENDATVQLQYTRDVLSGVVWLVVLAVTPQGSKAEGQEKVSLSS